jgi:hypothetical protein
MSERVRTLLTVTMPTGLLGGGRMALPSRLRASPELVQLAVLIACALQIRWIERARWRGLVRDLEANHFLNTLAGMLGQQALVAEWPTESKVLSMEIST